MVRRASIAATACLMENLGTYIIIPLVVRIEEQ